MRHLLVALVCLMAPGLAFANGNGDYRIEWDNFKNGFTVDSPTAKWFHLAIPGTSFVGDDGIPSTSSQGLRVVSPGTNPITGEPAFTSTVAPESQSHLFGPIDHVKWLVYMNHIASTGVPGHDAEPGKVLSCESWMGGRTYGTEFHPFGSAVQNANDDLRLAAFAMNTTDHESFMVFDFFITNETIYAFYERLPTGKSPENNYASFSFQIPVAVRTVNDNHHLKISYDRELGTVSWYVDDVEVFQVNKIGHRIDRQYLTLDHGGEDEIVDMRQLSCGMGTFTILDGYRPNGQGLVRLSEIPGIYFNPDQGEPAPMSFVDESSSLSSRLFGQGAELTMRKYVVSSKTR